MRKSLTARPLALVSLAIKPSARSVTVREEDSRVIRLPSSRTVTDRTHGVCMQKQCRMSMLHAHIVVVLS